MIFRLVIAGTALVCTVVSGIELAHRADGVLITPVDPIESTQELAAQERWGEVKLLSDFITTRDDLGSIEEAEDLSSRAEAELNSYPGQIERFAHGAVTGEPTDLYSTLGSLSLDIFVVGDIRDLAVQGWKEFTYGTGDEVIIALSIVGLTTSLIPHLDWVPAFLKALKRSGALTRRMIHSLSQTASQAIDSGNYARLSKVASDVGRMTRNLGPGPTQGVMRNIDSVDDLAKVANAADLNPVHTYAVTRLFGKNGVGLIRNDGKNIGMLGRSIKVGSRVTKTIKKATSFIPTLWLSIFFGASILILLSSIFIPRYRTKSRAGAMPYHRDRVSHSTLSRLAENT